MKVYLYYSKKNINEINDIEYVKEKVAKCITKIFDLFNDIAKNNVIVKCASISNDIDVFCVLDDGMGQEQLILLDRMNRFKLELLDIICEDQNKKYEYKIRTKIDPKHNGILMSDNKKNMDKKNDIQNGRYDEDNSELDYEKRAKAYIPVDPSYTFDRVILPKDVIEKLEEALNILKYERKVFEEWGLYEIQPNPSSSLSFFGPSGTGKTMAAEAVANKLGKKILKVSYADVESKYHGEGPKMVKAIFLAAEKEDAVLFFDEADSLLSKRLTNVSQGSEQAINSMRSQLLICLEEFRGIVIFATNLVINYDNAFLTRLISVEFVNPDVETRKKIWDVHIRTSESEGKYKLNIPLSDDVDTYVLAEKYDFAGREIRNAVISACISAAMKDKEIVTQEDFEIACDKIVKEKDSIAKAGDHTISDKTKDAVKKALMEKIKEGDVKHVSENIE